MRHAVVRFDALRGREPRRIVWDDEAGTVDGDHSDVPELRRILVGPLPHVVPSFFGTLTLHDPARSAADFVALLGYWHGWESYDHPPLPASLRDAVPTPWEMFPPPPPGTVQ